MDRAQGDQSEFGLIEDACVLTKGDKILFAGKQENLPNEYAKVVISHNLNHSLVTPALIDCHSHLVYGGNRAHEFNLRLKGASYAEIAKAGGGILSTVRATRSLDEDALLAEALPRLDALIKEGVSCIEIKSGYGLDIANEIKMLRVARRLATLRPITIKTSYLAAHALPPEYQGKADAYIQEVCMKGLQQAFDEGLVDAVDGFCEHIAFSPDQLKPLFELATSLGLAVKLHNEQLSNIGGSEFLSNYPALSSDHLEFIDQKGIEALAKSGIIAVILPGAFYYLRETKLPPIEDFRKYGVKMAVATDSNPGSSPLTSILLAMNMAAVFFRLSAEEALLGTTYHAALALGLHDRGQIKPNLRADLAVWGVSHPEELTCAIGANPLIYRIYGGNIK